MRYYDKNTHTETHTESGSTIISTDERVKEFFKPLPSDHRVVFIDDLPIIEQIPPPTEEEITAQIEEGNYQEWLNDKKLKEAKDKDAQDRADYAKLK